MFVSRRSLVATLVAAIIPCAAAQAAPARAGADPAFRPLLPKLATVRIPVYLPAHLPSDLRSSLKEQGTHQRLNVAPDRRSYTVSFYQPEIAGTTPFRVYLLKATGRAGGLGAIPARDRKITLSGGRVGYLDPQNGGTDNTNQLGPLLSWATGGNTYSLSINHNDSTAQLIRAANSEVQVRAGT